MNNRDKAPKLILIGGQSKSGKTEASAQLAQKLGNTLVVHLDDFYVDLSAIEDVKKRGDFNFDEPAAMDKEFLNKVVAAILKREKVKAPQHDFELHSRKPDLYEVDPTQVDYVIIEGLFALHRDLGLLDRADMTVFMNTDDRICTARRFLWGVKDQGRDVQGVYNQYIHSVMPMADLHTKPTKQFADVVIENNESIQPVLDHLAWLAKDDITIAKEAAAHVQAQVTDWFGTFAASATRMLVKAENKLGKYLEDGRYIDEAAAAPSQKPSQ